MTAPTAFQSASSAQTLATAGVVAGAAAFGTLPLFTRVLAEAGLASPAIAFWRFALTALVLLPLLRLGAGALRPTLWAMAGGAGMGLGWIGFVNSLGAMSIAEAGVLFMTYPAFTIAIAWLGFRERLRPVSIVATLLVVTAAVLAAPAGSLGGGTGEAVMLALFAPAAYGLLINILAYKTVSLRPLAVVGAVALGSVLALTPLVVRLPLHAIVPADLGALPWLFTFSVVTALLPQFLFALCAPRIGPVRTAISGSMELVSMLVVAVVAYAEALSPAQTLAALLIIVAVGLGARGRAPQPGPG
ncbi:MAG: hypothetical protein AcusKO_16230 [Acuticoccus sp.]